MDPSFFERSPDKASGPESTEEASGSMPLGQDPLEARTAARCLKRIRRWRVPPRWSRQDWLEEIEAEVTVATLQALSDFNPGRGVPWGAFLRIRIMCTALARYRREWSYALRRDSAGTLDVLAPAARDDVPLRDAATNLITEALGRLPHEDLSLIEGLFWEGKSEAQLAGFLGISQQAVSKRKRAIFRDLRRLIETLIKKTDCGL